MNHALVEPRSRSVRLQLYVVALVCLSLTTFTAMTMVHVRGRGVRACACNEIVYIAQGCHTVYVIMGIGVLCSARIQARNLSKLTTTLSWSSHPFTHAPHMHKVRYIVCPVIDDPYYTILYYTHEP